MGLSEPTYTLDTSSRTAKEFLKCVGEELDRAHEVLSNLKTRGERKKSTLAIDSPYEFLRKLDKETLFTSRHRLENQKIDAATTTFEKQNALPPWWNDQPEILPLPEESPIAEQSEYTTTSSEDLDSTNLEIGQRLLRYDDGCRRHLCLGVRLLKINKLESDSYKDRESSTRLLYCPAVVVNQKDSTSSIASPFLLPRVVPSLPPGDLAAVVKKLRQMTTSVAKLQTQLAKSLETKKIQQLQQQRKDQVLKLTRF